MKFIINHKKKILGLALLGVVAAYATYTNTLTYPYIMAQRQIQSIVECTFGSTHFKTDTYGFSFSIPEGLCILPNRLFPTDGNVEILPKGWYFVFNEYAKGTVAEASKATILFEPIVPTRDPEKIIKTLLEGNFANAQNITSTTSATGVTYIIAEQVLGIDNQRYDWAITTRKDNKYFVEIITKHTEGTALRDYLVTTLQED